MQPCTDLPGVLRDNLWCPFPFLEQLGAPMDVVTAVCQGGDTQQHLMVLDLDLEI